jgi:hypothetical protein
MSRSRYSFGRDQEYIVSVRWDFDGALKEVEGFASLRSALPQTWRGISLNALEL